MPLGKYLQQVQGAKQDVPISGRFRRETQGRETQGTPNPTTYEALSIHPSIHPSIHLSLYPSVHLFIYPSIHLSTYLSTYPSTHTYTPAEPVSSHAAAMNYQGPFSKEITGSWLISRHDHLHRSPYCRAFMITNRIMVPYYHIP